MSKKFWQISDSVTSDGKELLIEGDISSVSWWGDESTPEDLRKELSELNGDITVRINSYGGDVFAGVNMYNALREHEGNVKVIVDGVAASIASVIAMAGDEIIMNPGSMMMVHKPWTMAAGNSKEMEETAKYLQKVEDTIVPIYVARTGMTADKVNELLDGAEGADGTWMTGEEAVEMGFATSSVGAKTSLAEAMNKVASLMKPVENAVMQPAMSLKKQLEEIPKAEAPVAEQQEEVEETDVTDTTETVDEVAVATEDTETTDETVEASETTEEVEPKVNNSDNKETKMSDVDTQAAAQVIEPKGQAPTDAPKAKASTQAEVKAYLKTNEAMQAFANILQANPGDVGSGSAKVVRDAFKEHVEVKLGVTNPEIFLPTPLVEAIQNAFEDGGEIWRRVSKTGVDVWNAAYDTEDDVNSNDGRARGYRRSEAEEKAEQVLTFDDRILRPQFVYKYITLNKEDIKEQRSTGALVTYILSELPQRIVREVERAIVLGDGRASGDDYKILEGDPRGFYNLLDDAVAGNFFGDSVTVSGDMSLAEAVSRAKDELRTGGEVVVIAKKGFGTDARFEKDVDGRLLFPLGTTARDIFDVSAVIEPDWFNDTNSPDVDAFVVVLSAYKVVGDTTIEGFQNFILKTNKQEYLQEIWAGGGLTGRKSVIAVTAGS